MAQWYQPASISGEEVDEWWSHNMPDYAPVEPTTARNAIMKERVREKSETCRSIEVAYQCIQALLEIT